MDLKGRRLLQRMRQASKESGNDEIWHGTERRIQAVNLSCKLCTCSNVRERVGYDHVCDACGVCRIVAHPSNGDRPGPAARCAGPFRLLRAVAVMVTILLRNCGRARQ